MIENIEVGTDWTLKEEQPVYKVVSVGSDGFSEYVKLDGLFNGWDLISRAEFLRKFKQVETVDVEREKLAVLIQSAKNLRSELKLYSSERFEWATYEDVMTNPVDCLIQALEDYEEQGR